MQRKTGFAMAACLALWTSAAQADGPAAKPRLIVAIAVDQFSADLFDQYRTHFSGGMKRLVQGAVFPRGYQSHAATETCPGHSTILTGDRPARTGIIANNWIDLSAARADKTVYCAEDETAPGSTSRDYIVSPRHLKVPTLGGRMKAWNPATRIVSVSGKDRAAVMLGGPAADQTWWWDSPRKKYVSYQGVGETPAVARINARTLADLARPQPAMPLPDWCAPYDRAVSIGGGKTVGTGRFARGPEDAPENASAPGALPEVFKASPEFDRTTLALAGALVEDMKLGQQVQTDLLAISLSATDYVGHSYGTEGAEMCIQLAAVDQMLGAFFDRLDALGIDYAVVLTADHGGNDLPERAREQSMPDAQRVNPILSPDVMDSTLSVTMGRYSRTVYGTGASGDVYIAHDLTPAQKTRVAAAMLHIWKQQPQVAAVFTRAELAATPPPPPGHPDAMTLRQKAAASFDARRSGDYVVLLKPRVTPIADPSKGYVATHGSPWDYDQRVPILFWRKGMTHFEQPQPVETIDIMPTLAALLGLPLKPGDIDGRCLDLVAGPATSCPAQ